jgi:hypothetical protein
MRLMTLWFCIFVGASLRHSMLNVSAVHLP